MRGALTLFIATLGAPLVCGVLFTALFVALVGLAIPQLPSWARGGVEAWMLGTPQAEGSDYHGQPGEGSDGVFTGGQVGFEGYAGPQSFICRIPAEKGSKTDDYGVPRDPYPDHSGIDYGTCHQHDVAVITPMGGRVVFAGWSRAGYGNLLVIENDGWQVYLGHNNSFLVGVGDVVRAGEAVALSGSTGNSSGPHVHFETRECIDGHCTPRDPNRVLLPGQSAYCAWGSLPGTCGG
jgi:murein DD-endopeptidase MepM/ murein hydrolase activator NlpD